MPLSEHEQRLLDQIERALYQEDPKFASSVRATDLRTHMRRRLRRAGLKTQIFPTDIAEQIWKHAQGNPRRINRLAEKCLLAAASAKRDLIDGPCLQQAVSEMQFHLSLIHI